MENLLFGPEQLGVVDPQLGVLGNLGRSNGKVGSVRHEASLVGGVGDSVGVAVVSDEAEGAGDVDGAGLGLGSGDGLAGRVRLEQRRTKHYVSIM